MVLDDFQQEDEPTLPPLDPRAGAVCPRCYKSPEPSAAPSGRTLARCPRHGLAYVDAREIVESGGDSLLGTTVAGRFTVLGRVGAGSMGAVYRARQAAVDRDVALKIVRAERAYDPETKVRFEREARATSALTSPHTITVFDFGEAEDGSWFLAMELLEGETLGDRLRRVGRIPLADAVRIAHEAATSLAEAHEKGIVHRDLKPDNLFLARVPRPAGAPSDAVKILDFGIAKLVRGEEQRVDQLETQAGTVFGTPRYMSPEQAQGTPLDARTDIYSLGVILYHMLAGRAPFIDDDAVVVMARHIKEVPPPLSAAAPDVVVPPALERVVQRALAKRASDRQQSAQQFAAELDTAALESSVIATGTYSTWAAPPFSQRPARGRRGLLLLGVAGALAVLAGVGFFAVRWAASAPPSSTAAAEPRELPSVEPPPAPSLAARPSTTAPAALPSSSTTPRVDAATTGRPKPRKIPRYVPPALPKQPDSPYGRFE